MDREDVLQFWQQAAEASVGLTHTDFLVNFAALVAAAEREECAKIVESLAIECEDTSHYAAEAIRARG